MSILDDIGETADEMVRQAGKALDQVKSRVETLQVKAQMDVAARRLGYLEFERYRGRPLDEVGHRRVLAELEAYEEQLTQLRADVTPDAAGSEPGLALVTPAPEETPPDHEQGS